MYSVFLMMLAVFCTHAYASTMSQDVEGPGLKTDDMSVIYEEPFEKDLGDFIVEGEKGPSGDPIWKWDEWGTQDCINASMWSGTDKDINSYLVSPVMKMGRDNSATFDHSVGYTISGSYSEYFGFCIREEGGAWEELVIPTFPLGTAKVSSGIIEIPDSYNGKNVQVAFRYHATPSMQLSWYVKKLVVKGIPVSDSGKEYAGIEFSSERASYLFGSGEAFVAPEFNNPNNLEVTFSSSNTDVATVDAVTGEVNIKALGKTVIKAESKETEKYEAGTAQYTLSVVTTLEKLDSGLEWDVKELETTFPQVSGFVQPVLKNPNNRPVTLSTSNENVAIIDASTGTIHIQGLGIATITATSPENDEYKAGNVSTTIIVTDITKVFAATFSQNTCGFVEEGTTGIWKWEDGCVKAAGKGIVSSNSESYLVSPEMTLGENGNFLKFDHICKNFSNPEEQATILVREVGTNTWSKTGSPWYFKEGVEGFINSGLVRIPKGFNGKKVQIAFKYVTDGNENAGEWSVRNLIITKTIIKKDAEISFNVSEVSYSIGSGEFESPVLNNPNNVPVEYMSDNYNVANIDRETGEVFITGTGTCTITARSKETIEFKQGVAQYTITVDDPYLIFRDSFNSVGYGSLGNFTEEGIAGCWGISWGLASTSPWNVEMNPGDESILVSPVITLAKEHNTLTFDQKFMFVNGTPEKYGEVVIRTVGGEWEKVNISYPTTEATEHSGNVALPENFCGKDVQIGFKYTKQEKVNGYEGTWTVNNIIIRNVEAAPQKKADPKLSFSETLVNYDMESGEAFVAPELNNPNNVSVSYESSNEDVAFVNSFLGWITIYGVGETTITAKSEETDLFAAGEASYTIVVTSATGIDSIEGMNLEKDVLYDLQGRKINKPAKGVYILNGKKIVIK